MKSFKEYLIEDTQLDEQDYQQVKDTVDKEVKRIRGNLFEDSKMLDRIANAMTDVGYDKSTSKKVKDAEKLMDQARKLLTSI